MIQFTIPSSYDMETIMNNQRIIEGTYSSRRITDYAVLKGAGVLPGIFSSSRVYPYWLKTETDDYTDHDDLYYGISPAQAVSEGWDRYAYSEDKTIGTRLMINYEDITKNGHRIKKIKKDDEILEIFEYGNYPQTLVSDEESEILDLLNKKGLLNVTGKTYSYNIGSVGKELKIESDTEYEYKNKKYVRVKKNNPDAVLPNGNKLTKDYYWVKVEPIKWYVNHKNKIAIAQKTFLGGIPYNQNPCNGLDNTYLGRFIKEVFTKEFNQDRSFLNKSNKTKISKDAIKIIKKSREKDREIDKEFGKTFDEEFKKETSKIKVKVIKKNK